MARTHNVQAGNRTGYLMYIVGNKVGKFFMRANTVRKVPWWEFTWNRLISLAHNAMSKLAFLNVTVYGHQQLPIQQFCYVIESSWKDMLCCIIPYENHIYTGRVCSLADMSVAFAQLQATWNISQQLDFSNNVDNPPGLTRSDLRNFTWNRAWVMSQLYFCL